MPNSRVLFVVPSRVTELATALMKHKVAIKGLEGARILRDYTAFLSQHKGDVIESSFGGPEVTPEPLDEVAHALDRSVGRYL